MTYTSTFCYRAPPAWYTWPDASGAGFLPPKTAVPSISSARSARSAAVDGLVVPRFCFFGEGFVILPDLPNLVVVRVDGILTCKMGGWWMVVDTLANADVDDWSEEWKVYKGVEESLIPTVSIVMSLL